MPTVCLAVFVAVKNRFRRWETRMNASCRAVVARGWPGRWRSLTVPVCWYRTISLETVEWWHPNLRAIALLELPARNMPIAWIRSSSLRRGILSSGQYLCPFCFYESPDNPLYTCLRVFHEKLVHHGKIPHYKKSTIMAPATHRVVMHR